LDELLALGTRDACRVLDLFDRERTMVAERAAHFARPSGRDHIEHILPSDQGFLVHQRESFRFDPFEAEAIVGTVLGSVNAPAGENATLRTSNA
jgi:hypothetical protein